MQQRSAAVHRIRWLQLQRKLHPRILSLPQMLLRAHGTAHPSCTTAASRDVHLVRSIAASAWAAAITAVNVVLQADKTETKAKLADRLINGLSGENKRWSESIKARLRCMLTAVLSFVPAHVSAHVTANLCSHFHASHTGTNRTMPFEHVVTEVLQLEGFPSLSPACSADQRQMRCHVHAGVRREGGQARGRRAHRRVVRVVLRAVQHAVPRGSRGR